jgi:hypothetical protein
VCVCVWYCTEKVAGSTLPRTLSRTLSGTLSNRQRYRCLNVVWGHATERKLFKQKLHNIIQTHHFSNLLIHKSQRKYIEINANRQKATHINTNHCKNMKMNENQWSSLTNRWQLIKINENHKESMKNIINLRKSVQTYENKLKLCKCMKIYENQCKLMNIYDIWKSMLWGLSGCQNASKSISEGLCRLVRAHS